MNVKNAGQRANFWKRPAAIKSTPAKNAAAMRCKSFSRLSLHQAAQNRLAVTAAQPERVH